MLSPEVWQFSPPKSARRVTNSPTEDCIIREILNHNFYHNVFVLFADTKQDIPFLFEYIFEEAPYYKINNCKLSELIHNEFVEGYLKKGLLSSLCIGKDANVENVVNVTSQNGFTLVLDAQSYHSLGIGGKKFRRANGDKGYYINIKLIDGIFQSQPKLYKHTLERLELFDTFTIIVRWEPHEEDICPSSIAKYFVERGLQVEACTPKLTKKRHHISQIPKPDIENINELVEWMGMIGIGGEFTLDNNFISKYEYDKNNCTGEGFITAFHISGLFSAEFVLKLRKFIRDEALMKNICYWTGLTVQTFTDAPSLRRLCQKKSCPSEENVLTLVMGENEILFQSFKAL